MKIHTITIIALFCYLSSATAQENVSRKGRINQVWISLINDSSLLRGSLYEIKDTSILLSNSIYKADYFSGNFQISEINYRNIYLIKTRKTNNIAIGLSVGVVSGIIIGGFIIGDEESHYLSQASTATENAIKGGLLFGSLGALIGSIKISFPIHGDINNFNKYRDKLKRRTIKSGSSTY